MASTGLWEQRHIVLLESKEDGRKVFNKGVR